MANFKKKPLTIYTLADKRPDFIRVQYDSFKKYLKDDYDYVIINNAIDSPSRQEEITKIAFQLDLKCIKVRFDANLVRVGGRVAIKDGKYTDGNLACAYPIKWAWRTICQSNIERLVVFIDSDMFVARKVSFAEELGDADAAFMIQYRGLEKNRTKALISYPWNGICIFDPQKIPDLREMKWDCGWIRTSLFHSEPVDVGGFANDWLKKHPIKVRPISEYAIYNFKKLGPNKIWLESVLCGNFHFSFTYDQRDRITSNFHCYEPGWQTGDGILPNFPKEYLETLLQKTINYFERYVLDKQTYPKPPILGLIEFESFNPNPNPFIIHHKGGQGYLVFSKRYGNLKLAFIKKTLGL